MTVAISSATADSAPSTPAAETLGFQAEVSQLLHLMVHSLYSNREIFLRELISNASDAADRLRFEAIAKPALLADDPELKISVALDPVARTVSVTDNGTGMTRDEVIRNLGTIARSGTGEFLNRLSETDRTDANLIGQFGVGFYSAFIVASRVEVRTRRAGEPASAGVLWQSDGQGQFQVAAIERAERGTEVLLHLRDDAVEFADEFKLRDLIRRYSDHIAFPVRMQVAKPAAATAEAAGDEVADTAESELANTGKALWTRPKSEVTDDEYREFYRHIAHDFQDPLAWSHNRVEGRREYTSLLFIPPRAPWDLYNRGAPRGVKLYVKRVFIMDDAEQFLPLYLRFMRGVVDSADLALNVSRELLQQDATVEAMRAGLTRRALDLLEKLATDDPEKYATVWKEFGRVLKEGPAEDRENSERIARLLRFASTRTDTDVQSHSLADYIARKPASQNTIWYVMADSFGAAKGSPHLEVFRRQGIEVLLLSDTIDEWLIGHLGKFDGLEFRDVRRGELDLDGVDATAGKPADAEKASSEHQPLLDRMKKALEGQVADVRTTTRLTESPACLVIGEFEMSAQMRRLMQATGQTVPDSKPILEINAAHPLIQRLAAEQTDARFGDLSLLLLDQARLAEGAQLAEPAAFVQRLNKLLLELGSP
jgi:molecular chaperone HtpG